MDLRAEESADHDAVRALHRRAFGDDGDTVARLADALRADDSGALSLVATEAHRVVGHVLFSENLLDAPRQLVPVSVLSPLAVDPAAQQRGIGGALVGEGLGRLAAQGVPVVFVEGDPRYYGRFGFTPGGRDGFRRPSLRIPEGAFQAVRLPAYEAWMTGTLVYRATFWTHDCVGLREPEPESLG